MRKKRVIFAGILAAGMAISSLSVWAQEDDATAEGYTETGEEWSSVVTYSQNGENRIYGKFYFPADYDETKTYPTIIMSHGFASSHEAQFEAADWPQYMAGKGYISYTYDFCGGSPDSLSDGDFQDMSVMTEVSDLNAVIDFVKEQPFVEQNHLFLMGSSQGGLVSALTAADRTEDINGMILLYPAFCIPDDMREQYPVFDDIPEDSVVQALGMDVGSQYVTDIYDMDVMEAIDGFAGDVLIIHGIGDVLVPYTDSVLAVEGPYGESSSEVYLLNGENTEHGFDTFHEETREKAHSAAADYLERQIEP